VRNIVSSGAMWTPCARGYWPSPHDRRKLPSRSNTMIGYSPRLNTQGEQKRIFRLIRGWNGPNSRGSAACTATPSLTATTARQPVAPQGDAAAALHRPDHRRRRLSRKRRDRPSGPAALALRYDGVISHPPHRPRPARRLAKPPNQRRRCHHLPADERQFRVIPAAVARSRAPRRSEAALSAPATCKSRRPDAPAIDNTPKVTRRSARPRVDE
jgi:hypothetical protein